MRMQENRKFVRWQVQGPARLTLYGRDGEEERMALLRDISFAGAQFSISESLRLNDKIGMALEITNEGNPVCCQGKVVWQRSIEEGGSPHFVCGILFTQLNDQDKEKIFKYAGNSAPGNQGNSSQKDAK